MSATQPSQSPQNATSGQGTIGGETNAETSKSSGGWFGIGGLSGSAGWQQTELALYAMKMGLVGMIAGSIYGVIKGGAAEKGLLVEISPEVEAFDMDPMARVLFGKLAKYRHLHEAAYVKAVLHCDNVFLREREIQRTKRPNAADQSLSETFILSCLGNLILLREKARDGPTMSAIGVIKDEIAEMLKEHQQRIYHMCASCHI
jgi:hypothetical protein